jgi:hypothetical protein
MMENQIQLAQPNTGVIPDAVPSASGEQPSEARIGKKWHLRTTLLFIFISCTLLWAAIIGAFFRFP